MPKEDRYKINVIPCNTNTMSKKSNSRAKSVDDLVSKKSDSPDNRGTSNIEFDADVIQEVTKRNLEMIALSTKVINRRANRIRSSEY
jgi:hypothetical protein